MKRDERCVDRENKKISKTWILTPYRQKAPVSVQPHRASGICADKKNVNFSPYWSRDACISGCYEGAIFPQGTKIKLQTRGLNGESWSLKEKEIILHQKVHSRHVVWEIKGKGKTIPTPSEVN